MTPALPEHCPAHRQTPHRSTEPHPGRRVGVADGKIYFACGCEINQHQAPYEVLQPACRVPPPALAQDEYIDREGRVIKLDEYPARLAPPETPSNPPTTPELQKP
jgi:hypothetical protein